MGFHRRAEAWDAGDVPESLVDLIKKHALDATAWHVLARAGKNGYSASGMELEVVDDGSPHTVADLAGAVIQMMMEHYQAHAAPYYKVQAFDGEKLLDDVVVQLGPDGPEDLGNLTGGAWAFKALDATHKRYLDVLKEIGGMTEMVKSSLDAMAGAIAQVCDVMLNNAAATSSDAATAAENERKWKREDKFFDFIIAHAQAGKSSNPLADVFQAMPQDQRDLCKAAVGDELFAMFVKAAGTDDPVARKNIIVAALGRVTEPQKVALGKMAPEWQTKLEAAFAATLQAG